MAMTTAAANNLLDLLFTNVNWAAIGDATGLVKSTVDGVFYLSLHTSSPAAAGTQTTNEATFTSYARLSVVRTTSGWTVTNNVCDNVAELLFVAATGGSNSITHIGVGTDSSGAGNLVAFGALDATLVVSNGVQPKFAIGDLNFTVATS